MRPLATAPQLRVRQTIMEADLFTPQVDPKLFHHNFRAALEEYSIGERRVISDWARGFIDRDGKFVKEFQTTFNSSLWELYLNASLKELGFSIDYSYGQPDFMIHKDGYTLVVEATTANAADGKPKEWEKDISKEALMSLEFDISMINREAIIRLSNAFSSKLKKYKDSYQKAKHVIGKPFIIAIAPFEQPYFNLQCDRPIRALLYDYYIDEEAYLKAPENFPLGPLGISLGSIEKDSGAEIDLGFFNSDITEDVSAVIFSSLATWGKLDALSTNSPKIALFNYLRHDKSGVPKKYGGVKREDYDEVLLDGFQVYHNPFAKRPAPPSLFKQKGVVQHYYDSSKGEWVYEGLPESLAWRQVFCSDSIK